MKLQLVKHVLNSIAYCACREVKLLWFPPSPYILNRDLQDCAELHFLWADRDKIGKNSWKTSVYFHLSVYIYIYICIYRVSQEECARLREGVPYVKVYGYNPKHLYPKLNGYGDNGMRKVGASCGSKNCNLHS